MAETRRHRKPLAAFDLDGTLYRGSLLARLADRLCHSGLVKEGLAGMMAQLSDERHARRIGQREFEQKLVGLLLVALRGKETARVRTEATRIVGDDAGRIYAFTAALLSLLKPTHDCIAVTGGLSETADGLADIWGFDACYRCILEEKDGRYTGRISSTPVRNKGQAIETRLVSKQGLTDVGSVGIGDTGADRTMLQKVKLALAFNPDGELAREADSRGWTTVIERKDRIYVIRHGLCRAYGPGEAVSAARDVLNETHPLQ